MKKILENLLLIALLFLPVISFASNARYFGTSTVASQSITKLATVTGIDATTVAVTPLFTVPTGKSAVITSVVIRCTVADTVAVSATASLGSEAVTFANWFAAEDIIVADTNEFIIKTATTAVAIVSLAGEVFSLNITTGATATSQTIAVDVFGYLL
jgi:hypothetical protein